MLNSKNSSNLLGFALVILATFFFSLKSIFIKLAYQYDVEPITLLCLRMLFALPFFLFVVWSQHCKNKARLISFKTYSIILVLGLFGYYLASLFDFIGLQYISAGLGRLILFLYPTLTLIISILFLNHKLTLKQALALFLSYFGLLLVFVPIIESVTEDFYFGVILVFLSALTFAIYLTGSSRQIQKIGSQRYTALAMSVSCFAVIIHFLLTEEFNDLIQPNIVYAYGFAIAIISTVLPAFLMSAGIYHLGVVSATMVGSIGPVFTIIIGVIFLDETMTLIQIFGAGIIIFGIYQLKTKTQKIPEKVIEVD